MSEEFHKAGGAMTHPRCWNALPWYVNGTLDAQEVGAVERHIANCDECATELKMQRALQAQLRDGDAVLMAPQSSWPKMLARLDDEDDALMKRKGERGGAWRWAVAAQALIIVGLSGTIWQQARTPDGDARLEPRYRTLTTDSVTARMSGSQDLVRVVFRRDLALTEVNGLLRSLGVQVVAGPSDADVYILTPTQANGASPSADELLERLRADARIVFAEPSRY